MLNNEQTTPTYHHAYASHTHEPTRHNNYKKDRKNNSHGSTQKQQKSVRIISFGEYIILSEYLMFINYNGARGAMSNDDAYIV